MNFASCQCGHEKRDHRAGLAGKKYGACKVCLCNEYAKPLPADLPLTVKCVAP